MAYFPAFLQLENKSILIVGGGYIALEKLEKLLDFTNDISIISLEYSDAMLKEINDNNLTYEQRAYEVGDIRDCAIVIVAVDSLELQEEIFYESKNYNCLCNSVDSVKFCDFIFPSYVKREELTVAISTSGTSPAFAKEMKTLRQTIPKGKERMKMLDNKAKDYVSKL